MTFRPALVQSDSVEVLDRPLPQNPDAERAVLGSILINNSAFHRVVGLIDTEDFCRDAHRAIFAVMRTLAGQGQEIDMLTLKDELSKRAQLDHVGGAAYISALSDGIPDVANVERYARIVKDKSTLRRFIVMGNSAMRAALDVGVEPEEVLAGVENSLRKIREGLPVAQDDGFRFVAQLPEPGQQAYVVDKMIPKHFVTILFALAGSRKSFLALFIALHVAIGRPIFGRPVTRTNVLILDGETDEQVVRRRAGPAANGMGLDAIPPNIVYRRVGSLMNEREAYTIEQFIKDNGIGLVVIDSWSACVPGDDVNSLDDVIKRLKSLDRFGTVLLIDHTRKNNDGDATPFGSSAKQNHARSVLQLTGTAEGAVLKQTKASFDAPVDAIAFTLNFSPDMITLDQIGVDDARVEEAAARTVPVLQRISAAYEAGQFAAGGTLDDVAEALDINPKTARNKLAILTAKGILRKEGHAWFLNGSCPAPALPLKKGGGRARGIARES